MRPSLLCIPLLTAACAVDLNVGDATTNPDGTGRDDALAGNLGVLAADDTDVDDTALDDDDGDPAEDTDAEDTDAPAPQTCTPDEWVSSTFSFPPDALSCSGAQVVRFDATQGLWVGLVHCGGTAMRVYLSAAEAGPYLPALDVAGHGQDHCELIDPAFTIPNEDDITSGGCSGCATSTNLPLEGVSGWYRAFFGEAFTYVDTTGAWSWQTSRIDCATDPAVCVP
jgi:hypothetical protein